MWITYFKILFDSWFYLYIHFLNCENNLTETITWKKYPFNFRLLQSKLKPPSALKSFPAVLAFFIKQTYLFYWTRNTRINFYPGRNFYNQNVYITWIAEFYSFWLSFQFSCLLNVPLTLNIIQLLKRRQLKWMEKRKKMV